MLRVLAASGLSDGSMQGVFEESIRGWPPKEESGEIIRSQIVLDHDRNQRILFFGWSSELKAMHIEFILRYCDKSHGYVELGAGSGWLAFLIKDRGVKIDAYDSMEGDTFVQNWTKQPWFKHVKKGSFEVRMSLR
mmetsp:Transcript_6617/g.16137  ORF Transcript_6617/g.16137 Transcript_6617/m.16137 type:complete len:135 (+) Transcript_6617:408-812(+)